VQREPFFAIESLNSYLIGPPDLAAQSDASHQ
jgi:hypothetical protein